MTVERDANWVRYQGDSLATEFPYTFRIPEMAMVRVYLQDVASGSLVRLLDSSEYNITGVARDNYNGGTVTYPLTGPLLDDTQYILIMRETSYKQELSIDNQAGFYPESVEYQLDKIVFQIQQLNTKTAGSIGVAPGETPPDIYTVKQWYLDTGAAAQAAQESETYSHLWSSAPEDQSVNDGTRSGFSSFHWASKAEQDAAAANADKIQTGLDRVQTGLDVISTGGDRVQTGLDAVATGQDRVNTGADRIQTGLDLIATGADREVTELDRIQTGLDRVATGADRTQTGIDATTAETAKNKAQEWATKPEDQSVEPGLYSAFHWAKKAEQAAGGGVQSVGLSAPAGFDVSNSPVTVNGDLTFTYSAGYEGFTTALKDKINGIEAGAQVNLSVGSTSGTVAAGDDARFSDAREWIADTVTQADAEAGVSTDRKAWTAERVAQAVIANAPPQEVGLYTGSAKDEVNFPVGHQVLVNGVSASTFGPLNSSVTIRLGTDNAYSVSGSSALMSGVWRSRGLAGTMGLAQRSA